MNNNENAKASLENIDPEVRESIVASKRVKLIMKLVDDGETYNLFSDIKKDDKE